MLKVYTAPNGRTYQYEEGEQPKGWAEAEPKGKPAPKARRAANKSRAAQTK